MPHTAKPLSAVPPFLHPGSINFKRAPYEAWAKVGGRTASSDSYLSKTSLA